MKNYHPIKRIDLKGLTDDIWFEIYLRLPFPSIFILRRVSKTWFSILTSPNFLKKWYELNRSSLPWGIFPFINEWFVLNKWLMISYPEMHSRFIEGENQWFSLKHLMCFPFKKRVDLHLLGSSDGLLLLATSLYRQGKYLVCNPLTHKCVLLPPPPPTSRGNCEGVVTGFGCNGCFSESTSYNVIQVPQFEAASKEFKVRIFSSNLGGWNVYDVSCVEDVTWSKSDHDNYVTCDGVFYWFQMSKSKILAVDTNHGNKCRLIGLPERPGFNIDSRHRLGESEGLICYALINERERSLSVWVLKEDWCLMYKDYKFHDMLLEMELLIGEAGTVMVDLIMEIEVLGFSPVDKDVVILGYKGNKFGSKQHIWAYNVGTKGYEQLCDPLILSGGPYVLCDSRAIGYTPRPTILSTKKEKRKEKIEGNTNRSAPVLGKNNKGSKAETSHASAKQNSDIPSTSREVQQESTNGKRSRSSKPPEQKTVALSGYPILAAAFRESLTSVVGESFLEKGLALLGDSKVKEMESQWNILQQAEAEVYLKRVDLMREQAAMVLNAYKSFNS